MTKSRADAAEARLACTTHNEGIVGLNIRPGVEHHGKEKRHTSAASAGERIRWVVWIFMSQMNDLLENDDLARSPFYYMLRALVYLPSEHC